MFGDVRLLIEGRLGLTQEEGFRKVEGESVFKYLSRSVNLPEDFAIEGDQTKVTLGIHYIHQDNFSLQTFNIGSISVWKVWLLLFQRFTLLCLQSAGPNVFYYYIIVIVSISYSLNNKDASHCVYFFTLRSQ